MKTLQPFGQERERSVQALQALHYKMNRRIPLWDKDGLLTFENEDDIEPKHTSVKLKACR